MPILHEEIVIYGTGLEGEKFWCKYHESYNIVFAVDRNCNRMFHKMPVYSFEEVKYNLSKTFIVVTTTFSVYEEISKNLKSIGLTEFDNYVWAGAFNKKLAILFGNCHMNVLDGYLNSNPYFNRKYYIKTYLVSHLNEKYPDDREWRRCDLLITQDIREDNYLGVPGALSLKARISDECICITIPNLYGFNLFWPQLGETFDYSQIERLHNNKDAIDLDNYSTQSVETIKGHIKNMVFDRDIYLEKAIQEGGINRGVYCLEKESHWSKDAIKENFYAAMDKIKKREKECDIVISDFLEANYKSELLFYDIRHPTNIVMKEKCNRILQRLSIPIYEPKRMVHVMDADEIFIYGCVKAALGLNFEQEYIRGCHSVHTLENQALNRAEYVEQYKNWIGI